MTLVRRVLFVSLGLAAGGLALGYALAGHWIWAALAIAVGLSWLLGQWRGWGWVASAGLLAWAALAAIGFWVDLGAGWMLCGMVAALTAWDLDHLVRRIGGLAGDERVRDLQRRHLRRLLLVDGVALSIMAIALGIDVKFSFAVALLLGLLAVLGLSRMIDALNRESR
jgi:uncharacterized membrane protein